MNFVIANDENLKEVKGELVVVIDILRAFTTACYAIKSNPKDYIVIDDIESAQELKKENPDSILMGERNGFDIPGFDYGNSPTEIKDRDFSNKIVIHTTTLGTKGIINALKYTEKVITGSFVNAKAVIDYIKKEKPGCVYLFCTSGTSDDNEDLMFAKYTKGYFENKILDINIIKDNLMKHESGTNYLVNPTTEYSKNDFFLALELNKFNFVIEARLGKDNLIHLRRVDFQES